MYADFLLILPIQPLGIEEHLDGARVGFVKWWPSAAVLNLLRHVGVDIESECDAAVAVGIMAPKYGVSPRLAKAQYAILAREFIFPAAKGAAEYGVGLCHRPQFERIIEIVERSYLDATVSNVAESVGDRCEVVSANAH